LSYSQQCATALLKALPKESEYRALAFNRLDPGKHVYAIDDLDDEFAGLLPCRMTVVGRGQKYGCRPGALDEFKRRGTRSALFGLFAAVRSTFSPYAHVAVFVRQPGVRLGRDTHLVIHDQFRLRCGDDESILHWVVAGKRRIDVERRATFCQSVSEHWRRKEGLARPEDEYDPDIDPLGDDARGPYDLRSFRPGPERAEAARDFLVQMGEKPRWALKYRNMTDEQIVAHVNELNRNHPSYEPPTALEAYHELFHFCRLASEKVYLGGAPRDLSRCRICDDAGCGDVSGEEG